MNVKQWAKCEALEEREGREEGEVTVVNRSAVERRRARVRSNRRMPFSMDLERRVFSR